MERNQSEMRRRPTPDRPPMSDRPPMTDQPPVSDRPSENGMTGEGRLLFQVSTAGGAIPLPNAEVTVRRLRSLTDGSGGEVVAVLYTDEDGKTRVLPLPAPARELSQVPLRDGAPAPYSLYDADVRMGGFYDQLYSRIPVFDGITSIQHATLIPLPDNGVPDGERPDGEIIVEGEPSDL